MSCEYPNSETTEGRIERVLEAVKEIDAAELAEQVVPDEPLFTTPNLSDRDRLNSRLKLMGHLKDALPVLRKLLANFGRDGRNPFRVPAWELYDVLDCHDDPHRLERVQGSLAAMRHMEFDLSTPGEQTLTPRPILFADYLPGEPGGDGVFEIELQLWERNVQGWVEELVARSNPAAPGWQR